MSEKVTANAGFYGENGFDLEPPNSVFSSRRIADDQDEKAPTLRDDVQKWCDENLSGRYGTGLEYERLIGDEGKMTLNVGGEDITFHINTLCIRRVVRFEFEKDMIHFKMMFCG